MSGWIDIAKWPECVHMERPGIIFEIQNADGQSLFSHCVVPLPPMPWDWKSPPIKFRAIPRPKPEHTPPLPPPKG